MDYEFVGPFVLPIGRAHYVNVDKPAKSMTEGQPPKYQLTVVIPDGKETQEILARVNAYKTKCFGAKEVKLPIVPSPADTIEKHPWYAGKFRVRTSAKEEYKPKIYDASKALAVEGTIYPGCFIRTTVTMVGFKVPQNQGVMFILKSVQFIRDGERISTGMDDGTQYPDLIESDIEKVLKQFDSPSSSSDVY